jgi:proton glutamate symport protein
MTAAAPRPRVLSLTRQIFIGLAIGAAAGIFIHHHLEPASGLRVANAIRPFSTIFLNLIKMIIAPLIFATLVAGIAGAGHLRSVGRVGLRAMIYFEVVTTLALAIGLLVVNIIRPGAGVMLAGGVPSVPAPEQTWDQILVHAIPTSVIDAMARGDVLQIVVFSLIFGIAAAAVGEKGRPVVRLCQSISDTMFQFTNIVMRFAPIGVAAAMAYTVGTGGLNTLVGLGRLVATLYLALAIFFAAVLLPIAWWFRIPIRAFVRAVREPAVIAFSTTSSEAALPRAMERMEELGCPRRIVAFVLPLGYTFNLDGSTLYLALTAMFVAQAAGVDLPIGQQISMMVTLMLTSKGVAGVPRAALVILTGTLAAYGLPLEGAATVLGVDALMDMGRTMTNVVGNCLATAIVSKWEGEFALPSLVVTNRDS